MLNAIKSEQQLYKFLQRVFAREVDAAFIADLAATQPPEDDDVVSEALARMIDVAGEEGKDRNALLEELAVEYARLFIGPRNPPAIPFASFYLSESRALMTDETIAVRKIYLANNMVVENLYSTPDDHIAIELEFLAHLSGAMIEALVAGNSERTNELEKARELFIKEHMQQWIPSFVEAIDNANPHPFYQGAAHILEEVIMTQEPLSA